MRRFLLYTIPSLRVCVASQVVLFFLLLIPFQQVRWENSVSSVCIHPLEFLPSSVSSPLPQPRWGTHDRLASFMILSSLRQGLYGFEMRELQYVVGLGLLPSFCLGETEWRRTSCFVLPSPACYLKDALRCTHNLCDSLISFFHIQLANSSSINRRGMHCKILSKKNHTFVNG